jgi:hypothetical protein
MFSSKLKFVYDVSEGREGTSNLTAQQQNKKWDQ